MKKFGLVVVVLIMAFSMITGSVSTVSAAGLSKTVSVDITDMYWNSTNNYLAAEYTLSWSKYGVYSYEVQIYLITSLNTLSWVAGSGHSFFGKRTASYSDTETGENAYPVNRLNIAGDYEMILTLKDKNGVAIPGATVSDTFTYTASP